MLCTQLHKHSGCSARLCLFLITQGPERQDLSEKLTRNSFPPTARLTGLSDVCNLWLPQTLESHLGRSKYRLQGQEVTPTPQPTSKLLKYQQEGSV